MTETLNTKQEEAVSIINGPLLIIAGPGSGKTKTLTNRIAHLIKNNINPLNILAVTFTNKAADEMKERVRKLLKRTERTRQSKMLPFIGTFHSFCSKILRNEIHNIGYGKNFSIYDTTDQLSVIKHAMTDLNIDFDQFKPSTVLNTISAQKNELVDYKEYEDKADDYFPKTIAKIYSAYQISLKNSNALDFDDLIMLTVKIFQKFPNIIAKYQNQFKYILVDEYQDTNRAQYVLTNLLAGKYRNLCVVGDDSQGIYSFRGADFRNILSFEKDYPEARVVLLEQNYRSTQNILDAAHNIISKNTEKREKKLWTENPKGAQITVAQVDNEQQEGFFIVREIERLTRERKIPLSNFTVLYRTNAQSRAIEEAFIECNFPYKIVGSIRFYDRREIKDILAYCKAAINASDAVSLKRIIKAPTKGIGKISSADLVNFFKNKKINCTQRKLNALRKFKKLMNNIQKASNEQNLTNFLKHIIKESNYEAYTRDKTKQGEERWENIKELFTVTKKYDHMSPPEGLKAFIEETSLLSESDEVETNKNLVNLMTLHAAKGLEFSVVFIVGSEEGLLPHSQSLISPQQMEEERRLCYVGITRAKDLVYFVFTKARNLFGATQINPPSRFLADIPEHLIDFKEVSSYLDDFL